MARGRPVMCAAACLVAVMVTGMPATAGAGSQEQPDKSKPLTLEETEALVKARAAQRLKLEPGDIEIVESAERVWPDAGLGCVARRGVLGRDAVEGYRIVVTAGERRLIYHTDKYGRMRLCPAPTTRPLDRIQ